MTEVMALAREHGLLVLEDAAAAAGARCGEACVGSIGDLGAFSFQGAKMLVAGEGGMLVTADPDLFERLRHLSRQGRAGEHPFWVTAIAPKYAMSNVQAAIALAQLERAETLLEAKRRVHAWYRAELDEVDLLQLSSELPHTISAHWMTSVLVSERATDTRDELAAGLRRRGIDTRPTFCALSTYPMFAERAARSPVARAVAARGLNLPSGVSMGRAEVAAVATAVREVLGVER
jgi:perosamine synthetase